MAPVVILGGGLAGLAAAHACRQPWLLLERESRVGGLTRTEVEHGGFHFDATGHWLHLRDEGVRRWVTETLLPGQLVTLSRKAAIYSCGVFTRFPYQVNTHGLPADVIAENLLGFIDARFGEAGRALREREPANFEEFILRHLGAGFAKHFMVPYNRKLWTVPPSELSAAWCGRFVPKPELKEVVEGALGVVKEGIGYNASFLYPREGGIEALPRAMRAQLPSAPAPGEVRTQLWPTAVDWKGRKLTLSDGSSMPYAQLLSTIALPQLVELCAQGAAGAPESVRVAAGRLRATTVTYVKVGVRAPHRQPWHWIYLPEDGFRSYRIGAPAAVYAPLAPSGCASFSVEYSHQGELSRAQCEALAREELVRSQMVLPTDEILFAEAVEIPHAYVLYDGQYGAARDEIMGFLRTAGIETAGRYGQWEYSSMEDAILAGRAAAQRVTGGSA